MELAAIFGYSQRVVQEELNKLPHSVVIQNQVFDKKILQLQEEEIVKRLQAFHRDHPSQKGIRKSEFLSKLELPWAEVLIPALIEKRSISEVQEVLSLPSHHISVSGMDAAVIARIEQKFLGQKFMPPEPETIGAELNLKPLEMTRLLRVMLETGVLVKAQDLYFHRQSVEEAQRILIDFIGRNGHIKVTEFKQALGSSRKFTLSLLDYFDTHHITQREGDIRTLAEDHGSQ